MKKAFWKGMVILPWATFMEAMAKALAVSPLAAFSQPKRAQTKLKNTEPRKLPM